MAVQISCSDLGIQGCTHAAHGDTAGDVIREMVDHVRARHEIDLPGANAILAGETRDTWLDSADPGVALIVKRLNEALDLNPLPGSDTPAPTIGRTPNSN